MNNHVSIIAQAGGLFAVFAFIHFFVDWVFQSHAEAMVKHNHADVRAKHCIIYTIGFIPLIYFLHYTYWECIAALNILFWRNIFIYNPYDYCRITYNGFGRYTFFRNASINMINKEMFVQGKLVNVGIEHLGVVNGKVVYCSDNYLTLSTRLSSKYYISIEKIISFWCDDDKPEDIQWK